VGLAGGGELLVALLQSTLEVEDLLLELLDADLERGGVGRGAKAAALERLLTQQLGKALLERVELLGQAATGRRTAR